MYTLNRQLTGTAEQQIQQMQYTQQYYNPKISRPIVESKK
jgi:hypothetical protein